MAVIKCVKSNRSEGIVETRKNNLLYEVLGRQYTVEYLVYVDDVGDGPLNIYVSPLTPKIGDSYVFTNATADEHDFAATLQRMHATRTANRLIWNLRCTYDTDQLVAAQTDNPLYQPPQITWDSEPDERAVQRDVRGVTYQSSSQNPYDPPVMRRYNRGVLRIVRNEPSFDQATADKYANKINLLPFAGYNYAMARINSITGSSNVTNGIFYYQVTYEIAFNPFTWFDFILDQDWRDCDGNVFLDPRTKQPMTNQTPLNGRGKSIYDPIVKMLQHPLGVGGGQRDLRFDLNAADTSMYLENWTEVVNFPPPQNPGIDVPGVGTNIVPGPHNEFDILLEYGDTLDWAPVAGVLVGREPSFNPDTYYPIKKKDGTYDFTRTPKKQLLLPEIVTVTNITVVPTPPGGDPDDKTCLLTVKRGQKGTTARDHPRGATMYRMLPYYRKYQPFEFLDFSVLNLPLV